MTTCGKRGSTVRSWGQRWERGDLAVISAPHQPQYNYVSHSIFVFISVCQGIFQYFFCNGMFDSSDLKPGVLGVSIITLNVVQFSRYSKGVCSNSTQSQLVSIPFPYNVLWILYYVTLLCCHSVFVSISISIFSINTSTKTCGFSCIAFTKGKKQSQKRSAPQKSLFTALAGDDIDVRDWGGW